MASLKVKEILCFLHSALLFISGLLLIAFSVVICYRIFYHFTFIPSSTLGPFISLFVLGFIHLFLTWLGVKGPSREHDFHLLLFMAITLLLLIAECTVGIWSIVLWDDSDIQSVQLMTQSYEDLLKKDKFYSKEWDRLESKLKCCRFNELDDYPKIKEHFEIKNVTCTVTYTEGCKKPLIRYVKGLLVDGVLMGFICAVFHGFGIFLFITFFRSLKQERKERIQRRLQMQQQQHQINENAVAATAANGSQVANTPPPSASP